MGRTLVEEGMYILVGDFEADGFIPDPMSAMNGMYYMFS